MRTVVIKSEDKRFVLGEVYFPDTPDSQDDFTTAEVIEQAAHNFMINGYMRKMDIEHDSVESGNVFCESFIVRTDNHPDGFLNGAWVLGAYILDDEDWSAVKKGDLNGWSFSGLAYSEPVLCSVDVPVRLSGMTEKCELPDSGIPPHDHDIDIGFSEDGKVIPAYTGPATAGPPHTHLTTKTTATNPELDHSHRIVADR